MRVGDYLRKTRTDQKISADTVSHKTKINIRSLTALENNDFENLPSKVYVSAYVKNYCRSINIDNTEALRLLAQEYQEIADVAPVDEALLQTPNSKPIGELLNFVFKKFANKRIIISLGVLILLVSLTFKIKEIVENKLPSQTDVTTETSEESASEVVTNDEKEQLNQLINADIKEKQINVETTKEAPAVTATSETNPITSVEKPVAVTATPAKPEEKPISAEVEKSEDKKDTEKKDFSEYRPIQTPLYSLDPNASEVSDPDIYPAEFKNRVQSNKQNVFINALFADAWLRYKIDNEPVRQNTIKQGNKLFLQADESILIFLGNFTSTKVLYNNSLVNASAPAGVKSLIFPHEKRSEYFYPLFTKDEKGNVISSKEFMEANSN